jgi:hypothetical protein
MRSNGRSTKTSGIDRWTWSGICVGIALAIASLSGCTRNFFRQRADEEVDSVLAEKDKFPEWGIDQFHVYPDPRARFADSTNQDRPPLPPDDPAAKDLAPNPQKPGKAGVGEIEGLGYLKLLAEWDDQNRAEAAERLKKEGTPSTPRAFGESAEESQAKADVYTSTILRTEPRPDGPRPYLINLEQACELAVINSREYQDARENLYLVALPVTLERFSFAAQFFAADQAFRQWTGSQVAANPAPTATATGAPSIATADNSWNNNSNIGFAKLFSTGALLLFNFANQTALNLGPGRFVSSQSAINLDFVQPFLQGGGKAVTLEPLTQAERNLVYEIRSFARFRKELYVAVAGGGGGSITGAIYQPIGVVASPTYQPGQGLGNSGLTPGSIPSTPSIGNSGLAVNPGQSGVLGLQTALAAPVSGYLSTLLEAAQMKVDKFNIQKLESFFALAKALQEGGDISQLQTDQFEQQLLNGRASLLNDQQDFLLTVDELKEQLGIPVDIILELDDTPFRPLNEQVQRYEDLFNQFKTASDEPLRAGPASVAGEERKRFHRLITTSELVRGTHFRDAIQGRWGLWEKLSDDALQKLLNDYREQRRKLLDRQTELETRGRTLSTAEQETLKKANSEIDLGEFEGLLREYETQPWKNLPEPEVRRKRQQLMYGAVANSFIVVLIQARNERMDDLHKRWPVLAKVCVDGVDLMEADLDVAETACARHAMAHRLDLMNVRAQVVDSWRQIAVYANALLAPFTVQYALTSATPAGVAQPFDFSTNRTQQQIIFNSQLPLVRLNERNNYRASLINYQRQRRVLQRAEDEASYDVRQEMILLRQYLETYKIQTRQVELSYLTVENSLDTLQAPPSLLQANTDTATRAASLTNQLINAQTNLYNALFKMTTIWITYLNTRDQLYRDMELMPLDERGNWIDKTEECECPKPADEAAKAQAPAAPETREPPAGQLPAPQPVSPPPAKGQAPAGQLPAPQPVSPPPAKGQAPAGELPAPQPIPPMPQGTPLPPIEK